MARSFLLPFTLLLCLFAKAQTGIYSCLDASDGLSDNQVVHILQLEDGRMVITTHGNINIYDGLRFHYIHRNDSNIYELGNYRGAYHVYIGEDDILWVKDYKKVWCLDVRHKRYLESPEQVFHQMGLKEAVSDVFVDSNHNVWCLTRKGLWQSDRQAYIPLPTDAGELQDLDVMGDALFLFFSTGEVSCHSLRDGKIRYRQAAYPKEQQEQYKNTSLVVKAHGKFYQLRCGNRSGFFVFDPVTVQWRQLMDTPQFLCTLIVPSEEYAYISTQTGIWGINLSNGAHLLHPSIQLTDGSRLQTGFNTIFHDRQGGIWLGTVHQGLYYTHPERFKFTSAKGLDELGLTSHQTDALLSQKSRPSSFRGQSYNDVFTDSRGWTWCATSDGLHLFKSGNAAPQKFYTEDGLTNNFIHAITEDHHNDIWVTTSFGMSHIHIKEGEHDFLFTNYRHHEGTLKGEYKNQAVFNLPDHRILMGGIDGWTLFHPDSITFPTQSFHPLLIGMSLHGEAMDISTDSTDNAHHLAQAVPYTQHHTFKHHQNNIGFDFSALNYAWPSRTHYRYRLIHATDSTWYTAKPSDAGHLIDDKGNLHLNYPSLPPDEYHLEVMASTHPATWEGPVTRFSFMIEAPWWRTRTAYTIYLLASALSTIACIHLYIRISKRRIMRKHKEAILLLRIQHLIDRCNSYERNDITNAKCCTPEETSVNLHDKEFLHKAVALVEANLNNPKYSVEQLSKDLCMERSGLYKKLNHLMDQSPSLFIRSIRLKRAANLLLEGKMSISEIADQVGFSSASYMGKCFQEEFRCKPSEYAQRFKNGFFDDSNDFTKRNDLS